MTTGTMLTNAQAKVAEVCWMPRRKQYWVSEALKETENRNQWTNEQKKRPKKRDD